MITKRFSLRMMLIATAATAAIMALPIRRAILQKRGREWVASQNGHITFAHKYDYETGNFDHYAELSAPKWMVDTLGVDFFDTVHGVTLDNMLVEDLSPITDLQSLYALAIMIEIDDELDFAPLAELPRLRYLTLDYTNISAERLDKLRKLLPKVQVDSLQHPPPEN